MSGHTPGPWRVNQHEHADGELWLSIGHKDDERWIGPVADIKYLVTRPDEQWANARLIAAAPDLLHALKEMRASAWCSENQRALAIQLAEAAIAKAEGK